MKKAVIIIPVVLIIVVFFLFLSGFRLTPEAAARANPAVGRDSALVLQTKASVGETFVFKVKDYYVTVAPHKQGFLWQGNIACTTESINDKADLVRTLGRLSITGKTQYGTVWIIQSTDSGVAAVHVDSNVADFDENGIAILDWKQPVTQMPADASAVDSNGNKLYIYDDNDGRANFIDLNKMKWYKT